LPHLWQIQVWQLAPAQQHQLLPCQRCLNSLHHTVNGANTWMGFFDTCTAAAAAAASMDVNTESLTDAGARPSQCTVHRNPNAAMLQGVL
jgi:hypothetical protein